MNQTTRTGCIWLNVSSLSSVISVVIMTILSSAYPDIYFMSHKLRHFLYSPCYLSWNHFEHSHRTHNPSILRLLSPTSVQSRVSFDTHIISCDRKQQYFKTLLKTNLRAAHTYTGRLYACTENRRRQKILGLKEFLHCCCFALHHHRKWSKSQHWSNIILVLGFQLSAISLTCNLAELLISNALSFEGFILLLL